MKQANVKIGECYIAAVGFNRITVRVISASEPDIWGRIHFTVERADNGKILPKTRCAAALHTLTKGIERMHGP